MILATEAANEGILMSFKSPLHHGIKRSIKCCDFEVKRPEKPLNKTTNYLVASVDAFVALACCWANCAAALACLSFCNFWANFWYSSWAVAISSTSLPKSSKNSTFLQ